MNNYDFLADDLLVDALLLEVAGLLQNLLACGKPGSIDLMGLPLSPNCLAALDDRLGRGEVTATLNSAKPPSPASGGRAMKTNPAASSRS
jgi:hypothetical protein